MRLRPYEELVVDTNSISQHVRRGIMEVNTVISLNDPWLDSRWYRYRITALKNPPTFVAYHVSLYAKYCTLLQWL